MFCKIRKSIRYFGKIPTMWLTRCCPKLFEGFIILYTPNIQDIYTNLPLSIGNLGFQVKQIAYKLRWESLCYQQVINKRWRLIQLNHQREYSKLYFFCVELEIQKAVYLDASQSLQSLWGGGDDGDVTYRHQIGWTKISASCIICDC